MRKRKLLPKILTVMLFLSLSIVCITIYTGRCAQEKYLVRGVDVSAYQGNIDWEIIEKENIDFAYIKATEGSSFRDRKFKRNIEHIKETGIYAGAYHFMSFESDGESQAGNFISSVSAEDISLPPAIDLELYGDYNKNPPDAARVRDILDALIEKLHDAYGRMPVIYTNRRAYSLYLSGGYRDCDIWICDVIKKPSLPDGREWKFWQYSHRGELPGYVGEEKYIDLNVFSGSREDFEEYVK